MAIDKQRPKDINCIYSALIKAYKDSLSKVILQNKFINRYSINSISKKLVSHIK